MSVYECVQGSGIPYITKMAQRGQYPKFLWRYFLVPVRKQANKSHRMKCFENLKMPVVLCEG